MLNKEIEHADLWQWLWKVLKNLLCHQVVASTLGCKVERCLFYHRILQVCICEESQIFLEILVVATLWQWVVFPLHHQTKQKSHDTVSKSYILQDWSNFGKS